MYSTSLHGETTESHDKGYDRGRGEEWGLHTTTYTIYHTVCLVFLEFL